ncbi:HNH endonuclease [Oscillochloris sp. ZM17-4]|uniref:HNH endonuclease n=1 Tax=Oscillochloris sp. ZM17-4 TaxID=2866714 RepID=UPI001C72BD4A|nr:HNH endonuclease signature motif containing protein [Oscillochloris sp. ZM17-4]MBX0328682.1 HNH endonuclease [Oscillochloris sp. ZM17-4]
MSSYVPAALRRLVIARAAGRCEYCQFPQQAAFLSFEIEHIISEKHDGPTVAENLALACPYCNDHKGTDLGSLDPETDILTPFFHPRRQEWPAHFRIEGALIIPLTPEGRVTVKILRFNDPDRLVEREVLIQAGMYG